MQLTGRPGGDGGRAVVGRLSHQRGESARRMPALVWAIALAVAALRAVPFVALQASTPPPGSVYLPVPYIPSDWLQYVAFVRQLRDTGRFLLANPFTTEPQDPRFILLFHQFLGVLHTLTRIDLFWLLELSRPPLLLLVFGALWRFTGPVLRNFRERLAACVLAGFAGGLEQLALPLADRLAPAALLGQVHQDLWHLYGWSTFQAAYNPLWLAGLALLLWTLPVLLQPGGPRRWNERGRVALGLLLLALTHTYSALALLGTVSGVVVVEAVLAPAAGRARLPHTALAVLPGVLAWALITRWQLEDPVFLESSAALLGQQAPAVFWYPLTFGAVGFFALRGFQRWVREDHPWCLVIGGWLLGVLLLASSTLVNGYKFGFIRLFRG